MVVARRKFGTSYIRMDCRVSMWIKGDPNMIRMKHGMLFAAGAALLASLPSTADAQTRYFARQALSGIRTTTGSSGAPSEPTFTCGVPEQGYVASFSGGQMPGFAASSPADAQAKCNATKAPAPNLVLNLCLYSTADLYGAGRNAMAVWQDPAQTDHSRSYSNNTMIYYSSVCVRN